MTKREDNIEKEVERRVRYRCIAFWTSAMSMASMVGAWISANIHAVKVGLKAFWEAWLST